jgi:coenzyme PQQ precursor peptide PqqA
VVIGSHWRDIAPITSKITWETRMTWKTPKIVEVPVGMEINMYACAARK